MYAGDANESGTLGRGMWIKICGVTNEEDALLAVALGADALGFVFAPGSPRQVDARNGRRDPPPAPGRA